ncbi:MAG: hypothetical protein HYY04_05775 [Chloroflexi bacterium]|nr:hypothetical protein [Chloroflexota bacterium]
MSDASVTFDALAQWFAGNPRVARSKWFGKTCLKVDGKAFAVLFGGDVAFKLAGPAHAAALRIAGARLFDPRGEGNAFKEWVHVPAEQAATWPWLAEQAHEYVGQSGG